MPDSAPRHDSDPTVPIPATEMRAILAAEGHAPEPDDDTPTAPDLTVGRCDCDDGKAVIELDKGCYRGPVTCPKCNGTGLLPAAA